MSKALKSKKLLLQHSSMFLDGFSGLLNFKRLVEFVDLVVSVYIVSYRECIKRIMLKCAQLQDQDETLPVLVLFLAFRCQS